jgi:DNA processing protein
MACPACQRRSALIAALAPAISRLSLNRESLLGLLALPNDRLLREAKVENPSGLLRALELPLPTDTVPTALCRHDPDYPEALAQLDCAPAVLYAACTTGRLREMLAAPTVAILGGREYIPCARQIAFALARDLATAGVTVVSGLDRGLEGIAQHGVLHAGGRAIAVTTCAPQRPCTPRHEDLHRRILTRGAAVSELPPGFFPPERWLFVAAQRIIAALAGLIVVVEAGGHSCALFTAQIAADLGQDIAVVPWRITDPGGPRMFGLLRDGAHPVSCASDVLELLNDGMGVP